MVLGFIASMRPQVGRNVGSLSHKRRGKNSGAARPTTDSRSKKIRSRAPTCYVILRDMRGVTPPRVSHRGRRPTNRTTAVRSVGAPGLGPRAEASRRREEVVQWAVLTLRRVRWRRPKPRPFLRRGWDVGPSATEPGSADAGAAPGSKDPLPGFRLSCPSKEWLPAASSLSYTSVWSPHGLIKR